MGIATNFHGRIKINMTQKICTSDDLKQYIIDYILKNKNAFKQKECRSHMYVKMCILYILYDWFHDSTFDENLKFVCHFKKYKLIIFTETKSENKIIAMDLKDLIWMK